MKKKYLFVLLLVMCVGYFIPTGVFARENEIYHNIGIDYRFSVQDENGNSLKNLKFKLYDNTGSLSFESEYDSGINQYIVQRQDYYYGTYNWNRLAPVCVDGSVADFCDRISPVNQFKDYIKYKDDLLEISNENGFYAFLNSYSLHGNYVYDNYYSNVHYYNYYGYIPLILEEMSTHTKKIVMASENVTFSDNNHDIVYYYAGVYLFNHLNLSDYNLELMNDRIYGRNSFSDNVIFMRNAVYDYSDELWEQLNNGPIASSEMTFDSSVVLDASDSGAIDLSKPSIIQLSKSNQISSDNENEDSNNNIVNIITNPKTWNNGIVILVISMIVVIGSSILIIKKRNVKV